MVLLLRGLVYLLLVKTGVLRLVVGLMLDRRVPFVVKLIPPAAILYLLSPIDIVPDIIPLAGWIDDIFAVLVFTALFLGLSPGDVVQEHLQRGRPNSQGGGPNPKSDKPIINGKYRIVDDEEPGR